MRHPFFAAVATDVVGNVRTFRADGDGEDDGAVPDLDGWKVSRHGNGEVSLCAPDCDPGALTLGPNERSLAGRLLFKLANDLLDRRQHSSAD
jgi:hypothetical protein